MKRILKVFLWMIAIVVFILGINFRPDIPLDKLKEKYTNAASQFINIDGMSVHYRIEGEGIPLVLLHGTSASLHTWDEWTKTLSKSFKVIRLDLPAFGLTGPDPQNRYQMENYVAFLHAFLTKLNITHFHLAGNSLGGNIAWEYGLAFPNEVEKLILLDAAGIPTSGKKPFIFELARNPLTAKIVQYVTPEFIVKKNLEQVYADDSKITSKLITRYYELNRRAGNRAAFIERAKLNYNNNYLKLPLLKQPTLILWGEKDPWIPQEAAKKFEKLIPNNKLIIYKNVGHVPMEEIPEKSVMDALIFLQKGAL